MKQAFETFLLNGELRHALECLKLMDNYECVEQFREKIRKGSITQEKLDMYRESYDIMAREHFDDFMLAMEWNRPAKEQYWLPRREKLKSIADSLESLEKGDLNELFISMPPRSGKTTLMVMFVLWIMLRNSERSNLYCSYSETVVKVFYNGLIEILGDKTTYRWKELFPDAKIANQDAKDLLLNLGRKKRYASFTGRSLYGTLNGACDCNGYEIADDLISGIEEAMSKDRLNGAWTKVTNNYLARAKEGAKRLWIGTRWSVADPIARMIDLLENDPQFQGRKYEIVNRPALNSEDESNFEYGYGVGFSSDYYKQVRATFERSDDIASWLAQYQGEPVERSGTLFAPEDLRYFNGVLPDLDADRIFMSVDPAWGGGDYVASPIIYQYGDDLYVKDVIYNNGDKKITQPEIVHKAIENNVQAMYIEGTRTTSEYAEGVDKMLREMGHKVNMQTSVKHWAGQGKQQRIFDKAPDIRERMIFLESGYRSKEYQRFMENVFAFKMVNNNKQHDDAPDSLGMAIAFSYFGDAKVQVIKRMF